MGTMRMPDSAPITEANRKAIWPESEVRMPASRAPMPVDRGGAQRLAVQRQSEEQPQRDDEGDGGGIDRQTLAGETQRADDECGVRERRSALAFGAEEQQAKPLHREVSSRPRRSAAPARRCAPGAGRRGDRGTARSRRRSRATAPPRPGSARDGVPPISSGRAQWPAERHRRRRRARSSASAARAAPRRDRRRRRRPPSRERAWPCPASARTSARRRSARHR